MALCVQIYPMTSEPCNLPSINYQSNLIDINQFNPVNVLPASLTGYPLSISGEGFPTGVTIDASNGNITGSPTISGIYQSRIVVSNFCGQFFYPITFNIIEQCHPPASYYNRGYDIVENDIINIDIVSGGTLPITYSSSSLPAGLTIDSTTGHISGSTSQIGAFTSTIIASNACGQQEITVYFNVYPSSADCNTNQVYPELAIIEDSKTAIFTFVNNIPNPVFTSSCSDSIITLQGSNQLSDGCWVHTVAVKGINDNGLKKECVICLQQNNKCATLIVSCKAKRCGKKIKLRRDEIRARFFDDKCRGLI